MNITGAAAAADNNPPSKSQTNLYSQLLLALHVFHTVRTVDIMQLFNHLLFVGSNVLYKGYGGIVNALLRHSDRLLASAQRLHLGVECGDLPLTVVEQRPDAVLVLADGVGELGDFVVAVFVERAQDANARVTRLAVEPDRLVAMFSTLDVLLGLDVEQGVAACYLDPPHNSFLSPPCSGLCTSTACMYALTCDGLVSMHVTSVFSRFLC